MQLPKLPGARKAEREARRVAEQAPMSRLEERREQLRERFAQLQWDLGGAAYEMAARDFFRLDVLAKMAARLQTVDAELAEIERMARLERAGAAGACAGCGSLYAQGAIYCWRCGRNIHEANGSVVSAAASVPAVSPTDPGQVPFHEQAPEYPPGTLPDPNLPDSGTFIEMDFGPVPPEVDEGSAGNGPPPGPS